MSRLSDDEKRVFTDRIAELEEYRHLYHLECTKVMSREAIIEQLSETELAKDVTRLEDVLRVIENDMACVPKGQNVTEYVARLTEENKWMRREIERVGHALFTGTKTGYVGTEEDLQNIGQFVEGVCETVERMIELEEENTLLAEHNQALRKMFPMQDGPPITWVIAEMVYELYSAIYPPPNQSLERLGERGGFGWAEVKLLRDKYRKEFGYDAFDRMKKRWIDALLEEQE